MRFAVLLFLLVWYLIGCAVLLKLEANKLGISMREMIKQASLEGSAEDSVYHRRTSQVMLLAAFWPLALLAHWFGRNEKQQEEV